MRKLAILIVCSGLTMWTSGGIVTPDPDLGPHPAGYIFYDSTGHMGVQIMNPDRPVWKTQEQPTRDEALTSIAGYDAYSGTYDVHVAEGFVVHHTEISLDPSGVGRDRKRKFELRGNQLRLTPPPFKTTSGITVDETLVWERVQ